ncbi:MAG: hypothetical protein L3J73_05710, partial [Thermoplasmata archaeon]|nr:hypothetical protein [Thermoplasmata archaeon]
TGAVDLPGPSWTMIGGSDSGTLLGTYAWTGSAAGTWVSGGTTLLQSGQTFSVLASPQTLSGDNLLILGVGNGNLGCPFAGSVSVAIP